MSRLMEDLVKLSARRPPLAAALDLAPVLNASARGLPPSRPGTAGKRRPRILLPCQPVSASPHSVRAEDGVGAAAPRERPRSEEPRINGQSGDLTAKCERQSKELRELRRRYKESEGLLVAEQQRKQEAPAKVRVAQVAVQTEDYVSATVQAMRSDGHTLVLEDIEEQRLQLDTMHQEASAKSREVRQAQETIRLLRKELQQARLLTDQYREQVDALEAEKMANEKRPISRMSSPSHNDEYSGLLSRPASALSRPGSARSAESAAASRPVSARSGVPPRPLSATPARAPTTAWSSGDGSRASSPAPPATPISVPAWSNPGRIRRRRSDTPTIDGEQFVSQSPAPSPSVGQANSSEMLQTPTSQVEVCAFPRSPSPAASNPTGTPFGTPMNRPVLESSSDEDDDEDAHFRRERRAWTEARIIP